MGSALIIFSLFGCIEKLGLDSGGGATAPEDELGPKLEALNTRISVVSSASGLSNLEQDLSDYSTQAREDQRYSKYLPLISAQNKTLQLLSAYFDFVRESALIGNYGVDCSKNYSKLVTRLRFATTLAADASTEANTYWLSDRNSTSRLLLFAINKTGYKTMAAYADLLDEEYKRNCPALSKSPSKYPLPLSFNDSLSIAAEEAGDAYLVYGFKSALPPGTTVTATRAAGDVNTTLTKSSWFFFLDSDPWSPFGHDVRYVIIDAASGDYRVYAETMFPIIDGKAYWMTMEERQNASNVLFPADAAELFSRMANLSSRSEYHSYLYTNPLAGEGGLTGANNGKASESVQCCQSKKRFALIMTGSPDNMFQADTARMYNFLKGQGYTDDEINYLAAQSGVAGADAVTTIQTLADALTALQNNPACCDEIFIFLAGHGSQDPARKFRHKTTGEERWVRNPASLGPSAADWEFTGDTGNYHKIDVNGRATGGGFAQSDIIAGFLDKMKSCHITVFFQSCYSGAAVPLAAQPGVTVITPVDANSVGYGTDTGRAGWAAGSYFVQAYVNAYGKDNATADANHDNTVTDEEAFNFANKKNHDTMEDERAEFNRYADSETDAALKQRYRNWANNIKEQFGQFKRGPPCTCCYVNCTEATNWKCSVFEGKNIPNCAECAGKKIGDLCKALTITPPPPNETQLPGNGTTAGNGTATGGIPGGENGTQTTGYCGDGKIVSPEQCDLGSFDTNKCPQGTYCTKQCMCKALETSVVCGDGKISSPGEDCDGGNVATNICQSGYSCSICKCVPTVAVCGDGRITAPEECDHGNSVTERCPDGKTCSNCRCYEPGQVPTEGTHKECSGSYCVSVPGAGSDQCVSDSQCQEIPATHKACSNNACVSVSGSGSDECTSDSQCTQDAPTHKVCSGSSCVTVSGSGSNECSSDAQCTQVPAPYCGDQSVNGDEECDPTASPTGCDGETKCATNCKCVSPPTLNCAQICGYTSGAEEISGTFTSQSQCANAAKNHYGSTMCYLTCAYSYYYEVTNIAGSASCCCAMKKMFECSDCPGQNPQCPSEGTCQSHAPSWYQP